MRLIYLIFTLLTINLVYGQQFITLEGCITDAETSQPIGFAAISLKNSSIGTVSNTAGYYVFHIPEKKRNDTLLVSSVGYKAFILPLKSIVGKKLDIKLKPKVYSLSEVAVKPKDAAEIVRQAIAKIPENYPDKPINMDGFYREMTFENDTCVEMAEAACEFYYKPYGEEYDENKSLDQMYQYSETHFDYFFTYLDIAFPINPGDQTNVIEARSSNLLHKNRFKVVPRGSINSCISWDIIKNNVLSLKSKLIKKSRFKLEGITSYNNRQVYIIYYKSRTGRLDEGYFYIDTKTLAFVALRFETLNSKIKDKTTRYWTPALYSKKRKKCKDFEELINEQAIINYKEINGKWYLNTIRTEIQFDYVFSKHYIYHADQPKISYKINRELLINQVETKNVSEKKETSIIANSIYSILCEYDLDYNPEFWENYNLIKATPIQNNVLQQLEINKPLAKQYEEQFVVDKGMVPPKAKKIPAINPFTKLKDEYYWMQNIKDPEVLKYIDAENKYTNNYMLPLKSMRRNLYYEQLKRISKESKNEKSKIINGSYEYYFKQAKGKNYENIYRKRIASNLAEELIIDVKENVKSDPNYSIEDFSVSPSNKLITYTENFGLGYENLLIVKEISKNTNIDSLYNITGIIWSKNHDSFYYLEWDKTNRVNKLLKHTIGTKRKNDILIFEEKNPINEIAAVLFDKYLIIESTNDFYYNEIYLLDLSLQTEKPTVIAKRKEKTSHIIEIINDTLYSLSIENNNSYSLYRSQIGTPQQENWEKIISNSPGIMLNGFLVLKDYIVMEQTQNMLSSICIYNKLGKLLKTLTFNEETCTINLKDNFALRNSSSFQFEYTSLKTPNILYEYNIKKQEKKLVKQREIVGYNKKNYKTKLLWATSNDGVKIPISIVYNRTKSKKNGKSPLLLTAYGSYGKSVEPVFSSAILSLLDRGIIYAIAHVRGGGELGEDWHEQAMQLKKKNTFDDFINCANYLVMENYTSKGKIIAEGGSGGGLVMGVLANKEPRLFNTIILHAPYLDVLATVTDTSARFYSTEKGERGNPKRSDVFDYIKSYSPYQNIKKQDYPNILYYIGLNDNKVEYWQSIKSVAKLRALKTDNNKLFLKTELYAGHNGYSGSQALYAEYAFIYAFILDNLGIKY